MSEEDIVDIVMNIHQFNQDLTNLNIKQCETIEEQKQEIERLKNNKNKVVNDLLKRISNLEFEVEDKQREIEILNNIIKQVYEVFITSGNHFEDACDCIQIEEIITKYLKDSDK